ncbi:ABC transporter related protein [Desulfurobacterium thermolithotrophum DSM 11699]|uniref:ABC transporter related protein n=1 Tax=Desulfurobacterium thermolithotrophum (strain DSM 11699 / BSA) TaxID=868864 RepID=F0S0W2_DESTD|nr:ABC transporter ATP-binding protein [Desulfurobacterium thermolithotrophum]ADY72766.1 ABC transporter related protein [Desulfurobacterium thermolithotrophum DSM 11699]
MLEVKNLSYRNILYDISFKVKRGSVVGLIGKNGSGKTTLLRCIGGFLKSSGLITLDGEDLNNFSTRKRVLKVNYFPQILEISFPYTVFEFLLSSLVPLKGFFPSLADEDIKKVESYLKKLNIYHLKDRLFSTLSGGERIKVLITRLLLIDPDVYLFDEPAAFLDVKVLPFLAEIIEKLKKAEKIVIITAHDLNFLVDIADQFLGLKNGRLFFTGGRKEFLENVEHLFDTKLKVLKLKEEVFIKSNLRR